MQGRVFLKKCKNLFFWQGFFLFYATKITDRYLQSFKIFGFMRGDFYKPQLIKIYSYPFFQKLFIAKTKLSKQRDHRASLGNEIDNYFLFIKKRFLFLYAFKKQLKLNCGNRNFLQRWKSECRYFMFLMLICTQSFSI